MARKKNAVPASTAGFDLRFKASDQPLDPDAKRFDVFLIDTGWNDPITRVVHTHFKTLYNFEREDSFYILSREQSIEILRHVPHLIGHDPIILVYDLYAPAQRKSRGYRGFRLNLGLLKRPEQALARLQE